MAVEKRSLHLEELPFEVLQAIGEQLGLGSGPHLSAFARTSKKCYKAAASSLFHTIRFSIHNQEQVDIDIDFWQSILAERDAHRYVRRLDVKDSTAPGQPHHWATKPTPFDLLDSDDDFYDGPILKPTLPLPQGMKKWNWLGLAQLLESLIALKTLHWSSCRPFTASLLQVLQAHHPSCRLHLDNFSFRTYLFATANQHEYTNPLSPALLTSPSLFSLRSQENRRDHWGHGIEGDKRPSDHEFLKSLNRINPALERLTIHADYFYRTKALANACEQELLESNFGVLSLGQRKLRLRHLELLGMDKHNLDFTHALLDRCATDALRVLRIQSATSQWAARSHLATMSNYFQSLTTLVIGGFVGGTDDETIAPFIRNLPPLKAFRLIDNFDNQIFAALLDCHSKSLRRLWLPQKPPSYAHGREWLDSPQLLKLYTEFPYLEDLALSLYRTKGNASEVDNYRYIGGIPRLRRISITFLCQDARLRVQRNVSRAAMLESNRNTLINAALDERLARSIFQTIQGAKPADAHPLEHLELRPIYPGDSRFPYIPHEAIGKWWLLKRNENQNHRDEVFVTEIPHPGVYYDMCDLSMPRQHFLDAPLVDMPSQMKPLFRELWPKDSGLGWRMDWHSFPLAAEEGDRGGISEEVWVVQ